MYVCQSSLDAKRIANSISHCAAYPLVDKPATQQGGKIAAFGFIRRIIYSVYYSASSIEADRVHAHVHVQMYGHTQGRIERDAWQCMVYFGRQLKD